LFASFQNTANIHCHWVFLILASTVKMDKNKPIQLSLCSHFESSLTKYKVASRRHTAYGIDHHTISHYHTVGTPTLRHDIPWCNCQSSTTKATQTNLVVSWRDTFVWSFESCLVHWQKWFWKYSCRTFWHDFHGVRVESQAWRECWTMMLMRRKRRTKFQRRTVVLC
jgi:hypothetical protein